MNFEDAWTLTMSWEGGSKLHTVPGDPGGTTKYGISQRAYPNMDMASLGPEVAKDIARIDYWDRVRADELPGELRWHVFDTAFNSGVGRAGRILQRAINMGIEARRVQNNNPYAMTTYVDVDGRIGPQTLNHLSHLPGDRLVRLFKAYRIEHYLMVAKRTPQFIDGWLRRAEGEYNG